MKAISKRAMGVGLRLPRAQWVAGVAALWLALPAWAGSPRVNAVFPAVAQRGGEGAFECKGSNLEDAAGAIFDEPGFEVTREGGDKSHVKFKLKVGAGVALGEHRFRVVTASGVSDVRLFYVTPFPVVMEVENKAEPKARQPLELGSTVVGRTQGEDQDYFEVTAKKGQRIGLEIIGARLQGETIYDPTLSVHQPDGSRLLEVDDTVFSRQDPVASFVAPADGKYLITVSEVTAAGQGECQYVLSVGSFARPLAVYPPGGPSGEALKVTLLGDAAGPKERTLKLPAQRDGDWKIYTSDEQPTPQPNLFRVSRLANVLEAEPNNQWGQATVAAKAPPIALNGVIGEKGDRDHFKLSAKKDEVYDVKVWARRLRSPLDSVLTILDAKGGTVLANDDDGNLDSGLRWKVATDGDYVVRIEDKLGRGGPLYTYRVELTPEQPRIGMWLPEMVQNSNQERRAIVVPKANRYASLVRVKRTDFAGPLVLSATGLPPGIAVTGLEVDKSTDAVPMVFEAGAEAVAGATAIGLEAKAVDPQKPLESAVEMDVDVVGNGNQRPFYSVREDYLALAVTDEIPVKLELMQPKVPILRGGALNLKVVATRKGEFKGPIALALLYTPTGIGTAGTMQIAEGASEANLALSANGDAPLAQWKVCVVGSADFGKGVVWFSTQLVTLTVAEPMMGGQIVRAAVDQGESTTLTVKLDHKAPFEGRAKVSLLGLPPNTTAADQEITANDKEVKFTVRAEANAPAATHKQLFCQFALQKDGETLTQSFASGGVLRIDKGK